MTYGSKANEIEEAGNALSIATRNLPKTEVESVVRPTMGKPSISGLPLHNHNIL